MPITQFCYGSACYHPGMKRTASHSGPPQAIPRQKRSGYRLPVVHSEAASMVISSWAPAFDENDLAKLFGRAIVDALPAIEAKISAALESKVLRVLGHFAPDPQSLRPRCVDLATASAYLGLSPNTFRNEVADGLWPKPIRGGNASGRGKLLWDLHALDKALDLRSSPAAELDDGADWLNSLAP